MKNIHNKIETALYNYNANEFFPIMSGGKLLNKSDFIKYKAHCLLVKKTLV